jgi:hypothetical protein
VPEQVATARFPDAGAVNVPVNQLAEHVDRRPFPFGRQEEGRFGEGAGEARPDLDEVFFDPFERPRSYRNDSVLPFPSSTRSNCRSGSTCWRSRLMGYENASQCSGT